MAEICPFRGSWRTARKRRIIAGGRRGLPAGSFRLPGRHRPRSRGSAPSARVSTTDQDLSIQEAVLTAAGCEVIRAEKRSGTTTAGREELRTVLDFLRKGDVLMVTRIDRLARSIGDLQDIVRTVKARGASLKATE
jgi:Resolvase, N terminal domain